ncbi:hypothetical protein [Bradyrhizobium iriomotense]|uniref:hypothetical protein n=1 Tax=Bradyrhizobium iriomotense TaxID=441950 RepID=UPI0024E0E484|nr:hypothetical protein [Bradyrhizobium iriomotense]
MAESRGKLPVAPCRVRKYKIQKATFVRSSAFFEEALRILGNRQQSYALIHIGLFGSLVTADLPQAALLLFTPFRCHPVVHDCVDPAVELVDVHRAQALREAVIFCLEPLYRLTMFLRFVFVALVQPFGDPFLNVVGETKPGKQGGESRLNHFFADIGLIAFSLIPGAVIVNVLTFLNFSHKRTSAMAAFHEA